MRAQSFTKTNPWVHKIYVTLAIDLEKFGRRPSISVRPRVDICGATHEVSSHDNCMTVTTKVPQHAHI